MSRHGFLGYEVGFAGLSQPRGGAEFHGWHAYYPDHKRSADIPEAMCHSVFAETDPAIIAKLAELN